MSDAGKRFCERCGAKIAPYEPVCPECGNAVDGQNPTSTAVSDDVLIRASKIVELLLGVFALVSFIQGIMFMLVNDMTVEMIRTLYTETQWTEYLTSMGLSSMEQYKNVMFLEGVVMTVDGAAVAVSFLCYHYRRSFTISIALCIYASLFLLVEFALYRMETIDTVFLVVQCLIGLYVARMIYITRELFEKI